MEVLHNSIFEPSNWRQMIERNEMVGHTSHSSSRCECFSTVCAIEGDRINCTGFLDLFFFFLKMRVTVGVDLDGSCCREDAGLDF